MMPSTQETQSSANNGPVCSNCNGIVHLQQDILYPSQSFVFSNKKIQKSIPVKKVLTEIFKLDYIPALRLLSSNEEIEEVLYFACEKCAHALSQLFFYYEELKRFHQGVDSLLSSQIKVLDNLVNQQVQKIVKKEVEAQPGPDEEETGISETIPTETIPTENDIILSTIPETIECTTTESTTTDEATSQEITTNNNSPSDQNIPIPKQKDTEMREPLIKLKRLEVDPKALTTAKTLKIKRTSRRLSSALGLDDNEDECENKKAKLDEKKENNNQNEEQVAGLQDWLSVFILNDVFKDGHPMDSSGESSKSESKIPDKINVKDPGPDDDEDVDDNISSCDSSCSTVVSTDVEEEDDGIVPKIVLPEKVVPLQMYECSDCSFETFSPSSFKHHQKLCTSKDPTFKLNALPTYPKDILCSNPNKKGTPPPTTTTKTFKKLENLEQSTSSSGSNSGHNSTIAPDGSDNWSPMPVDYCKLSSCTLASIWAKDHVNCRKETAAASNGSSSSSDNYQHKCMKCSATFELYKDFKEHVMTHQLVYNYY